MKVSKGLLCRRTLIVAGFTAAVLSLRSSYVAVDNEVTSSIVDSALTSFSDSMKTSKTCFPHNSLHWLHAHRFGNTEDPLMGKEGIKNILGLPNILRSPSIMRGILQQSLALPNSQFLLFDHDDDVRRWSVRLQYLAVYYHQHQPALGEAQARSNTLFCLQPQRQLNIGYFDYECPDAKYLVVSLSYMGLGSNMENIGIPALLAGLVTNRLVLFLNNVPAGKGFEGPWTLASCPRQDFHCFFAPLSPCVLTEEQLDNAYMLTSSEKKQLLWNGVLPAEHKHTKVIGLSGLASPSNLDGAAEKILRNISLSLIDQIPQHVPLHQLLQKAADHILTANGQGPEYAFRIARNKMWHALLFFILRPNPLMHQKLHSFLEDTLPLDFNADHSIGLPIRGKNCLCSVERKELAKKLTPNFLCTKHRISVEEKVNACLLHSI